MDNDPLYFIAFLPPPELSAKITELKVNFSTQYDCVKALKLFPHVTLQKPFKRSPVAEAEMHLNLQPIFESFKPFEISLNGFGSFDKKNNKVIYLHAEENNLLSEMHRKLMLLLRAEFNFSETETAFEFHPHITIASRDLSSENFHKAWLEYKDKPFRAKFYVNRAYLMKHNFKKWEVLSEFQFRSDI